MTAKSYCMIGLGLFGILGAVDFIQTYALIAHGDGLTYESNPVAAAWLDRYGWKGLLFFKAGCVIVFALVVFILRRHRPRTGAVLVTVGCLAVLAVTLYSRQLIEKSHEPRKPVAPIEDENDDSTGPIRNANE